MFGRIVEDNSTTGVYDRPLGLQQCFNRTFNLPPMTLVCGLIGAHFYVFRPLIGNFIVGISHILGDIHNHRPRPACSSYIVSFGNSFSDILGSGDQKAMFYYGTRDTHHIGLLKSVLTNFAHGNLTRNHDHWNGIHIGCCDASNGIGGSGTRSYKHCTHFTS